MNELHFDKGIVLPLSDIELTAIRSQGAGGQHVNKTSTAIQLRFPIQQSSLPEEVKARLLASGDRRINKDGVLTLKSQSYRSQEQNRIAALQRLEELISSLLRPAKPRKKSRPPRSSAEKRLEEKAKRGQVKSLRKKVDI